MKVVICGSVEKSWDQIMMAAGYLAENGCQVVVPSQKEENLILKRENYLDEIDEANLVVIIPKDSGAQFSEDDVNSLRFRLGESTSYEYLYAVRSGIPTVIWDHPNYESYFKPVETLVEKTSP